MRARFLHITAIAPAAALTAALCGPVAHAQSSGGPPRPVVVVIDPGHGGSANRDNPSQLFDPGAIGANGVEEKDVTLDVGKRLAALLETDEVRAVLTRTTDVFLTIAQREQVAIDNGAALFISIHVNSFIDPRVGGSLVLYPNAGARPFAQALSDALGRDLSVERVGDDGIQLRDNWWIHATMPTSTVEVAYLTNPREAALLATPQLREAIASAIRDGIERYDADIGARALQIRAWRAAHPVAPRGAPATAAPRGNVAARVSRSGSALGAVTFWAFVTAAVLAALRWPRLVVKLIVIAVAVVLRVLRLVFGHRRALRQRRRLHARRSARAVGPHSVYDELRL